MNKVILIGRVTKDIETRATSTGTPVALFTLAVNRDRKNAEGGYDADFINCVAFGQQATTINNWVNKGDKFAVAGRISTRNYEKEDGTKVYVTEVIVESFDFIESKKEKPTEDDAEDITYFDNDLPFN